MYINLYIYLSHFGQTSRCVAHAEKYQKCHSILHCETVICVIYIYSMMYYYISLCRVKPLLSTNINDIIIVKQ